MDSMSADQKRGLETTLPTSCYFDREGFWASIVSGDIDGAEAYLSEFTKIDSNSQSNVMFYFLRRQICLKLLVDGSFVEAAFMLLLRIMEIPIPETKDFINGDISRIGKLGKKAEDAHFEGTPFDIVPFANAYTKEMHQMMQTLLATNPDLEKKDISSQMQTLHI